MKTPMLFLLVIGLLCTSCVPVDTAASIQPAQTPNPAQGIFDANVSQATADAAVATANFHAAWLTTTVEAQHATATAQAWELERAAQVADITNTARAWEATTTADSMKSTSIAADTATASSVQSTATQRTLNITATTDAAAAQAYATAMAAEAINTDLAVQRAKMMNKVQATVPWIILLTILIMAVLWVVRRSRFYLIPRDQRGDAPLLIMKDRVYDADRNPLPLLDLAGEEPAIPLLTPLELQAPTTARDQMIDLATRGDTVAAPQHRRKEVAQQIGKEALPALPEVHLLPPTQAKPWVKDVFPHIIRDAIEADILSDEEDQP